MASAKYYQTLTDGAVKCVLCPHQCIIKPERFGICNVRQNVGGKLTSENYGILSSVALDPIEKKPLYHFFPGRKILSIGSYGCNLRCSFCQNCSISQAESTVFSGERSYDYTLLIEKALKEPGNIGIAYTYNEPTVFYEYMIDCAEETAKNELKNVVVSNGFINPDPLNRLIEITDAFNIDIKSFSDDFYRSIAGGAIQPVLNAIQQISDSGKHLELTYLVIPGLNDRERDFKELVKWIYNRCGRDTVLHISRYYPHHKLSVPPTPIDIIENFI